MDIGENIRVILERITRAAQRSGRSADNVKLIAVSKTHPAETVDEAIRNGINDIGENRIQEAAAKFDDVRERAVWHMIGHLQRNKVKTALKIFDTIHSVDSVSLAAEIDKRASRTIDFLVEVNIGEEKAKSGVMPDETLGLLKEVGTFAKLKCLGLMTIPPLTDDIERLRSYFRAVRDIQKEANRTNIFDNPLTELSMGMTNDFETAIEEGSTMVRVGRAIFGERIPYDPHH